MTWVLLAAIVALGVVAVLAIVRLVQGPTPIDRVIATDVLLAAVVCGLAIEAAINRHPFTVPVMLALSLVAFAGTVAVARFVAGRPGAIQDEEGA